MIPSILRVSQSSLLAIAILFINKRSAIYRRYKYSLFCLVDADREQSVLQWQPPVHRISWNMCFFSNIFPYFRNRSWLEFPSIFRCLYSCLYFTPTARHFKVLRAVHKITNKLSFYKHRALSFSTGLPSNRDTCTSIEISNIIATNAQHIFSVPGHF